MSVANITINRNPVNPGVLRTGITIPSQMIIPGSYRHITRAVGGFYKMEFKIQGDQKDLENLLQTALMAQVRSYNHEAALAWEGVITSMKLDLGHAMITMDIDTLVNKSWTRYLASGSAEDTGPTLQEWDAEAATRHQAEAAAGGTFARSTTYEDTDSQALWGIKEKVLSAAQLPSATPANQAASDLVAKFADPRQPIIDMKFSSNQVAKRPTLTFYCDGYWATLGWRVYNNTSGTTDTTENIISAILTAVGEFVKTQTITASTGTTVSELFDIDRQADNIITDLVNLGDSGGLRVLAGIYEDREFIMEEISLNQSPYYIVRGSRPFAYSPRNSVIDFSLIRPGRWILAEDVFITSPADHQGNLYTDPRAAFIEQITFRDPGDIQVVSSRSDLLNNIQARLGSASTGVN